MRVRRYRYQQSSIWTTRKQNVSWICNINTRCLNFQPTTTYLGVKLDRTLSYRQHLAGLKDKVMAHSALIRKLVGTGWGASPSTLRTSALALVYAPAEYCAPTWSRSRHTGLLDESLKGTSGRQKTYEIFHVYCIFYSGFMCQTTVIFGITKGGSLVLNTLASWTISLAETSFKMALTICQNV